MISAPSTARRIAALYALFAGAWIVLSDAALTLSAGDRWRPGQTVKGLLFVTVTSLLLYLLLRLEHQRQMRVTARLTVNEAILRSSGDVILLVALDGAIQRANPAVETILNITPDALTGRRLHTLIDAPQKKRFETAWQAVITRHDTYRLELDIHAAEGMIQADIVLSPVLEAGVLRGVVCTMRDISAWKRLEGWLRKMLTDAVEQASQSVEFVSIASHEIRTPLATIQLASELLANYGDRISDAERQQKFDQIRRNVTAMATLLEDVLTITRHASGRIPFDRQPVNPHRLCQDVLNVHREIAGIDHRFEFVVQNVCHDAQLDPRLVQLMLNNLLSNAVKYSAPGSTVTLRIRCTGEALVMQVSDEGIGIPPDAQAQLFDTFFRANNVGKIPGTGLGLAIVKQAVDLHGGTITVESKVNQGTTFTITLPSVPRSALPRQEHAQNAR